MINSVLRDRIASVDWDFANSWTGEGLHSLHWYPGKFIPQIASGLIRLLSRPGDTVCDPFSGCGTTAVEAVKLGRRALCCDVNPVGVMTSQVKCSVFSATSLRRHLAAIANEVAALRGGLFLISGRKESHAAYSELARWFAPETLTTLLMIQRAIDRHTLGKEQLFFHACLSHVLKSACSQEKHWGWIADNVAPRVMKERDILRLFNAHCDAMIDAVAHYYRHIDNSPGTSMSILEQSSAILHDCRQPIRHAPTVDAIITSPPYPCVIDFSKAQRLSYLLFGWDIEVDRRIEIGARWKRFRRSQEGEYRSDIQRAFANIDAILKPGGLMGLVFDGVSRKRCVLGESTRFDLLRCLKESFRYVILEDNITRRLSSQRLVDTSGSKNVERIVIVEKRR